MTISPDGHWLASGSAYGDFLLWDLGASPPRGPIVLLTRGHQGKPNNQMHAAAFTKDSKTLAVAGDGNSVELFDCSGQEPVERGVLPGLTEEVRSLTFSPDGKMLALAGLRDGSVRLWDVTGAIAAGESRVEADRRQPRALANVRMAPRSTGEAGPAPVVQKPPDGHRAPA